MKNVKGFFLDQRKRAKIQWIQDPSQNNVEILNNVRCEVSRHFTNKKKAYLRGKSQELVDHICQEVNAGSLILLSDITDYLG